MRAKIIDFKTRPFAKKLCAEAGLTKDGKPSHLRLVNEDSNIPPKEKLEEVKRIVKKADLLGVGVSGFILEFTKLKIDKLVERIIVKTSELIVRK